MGRRTRWVLLALLAQLALLLATIPVPTLGVPEWHHTASLAAALLFVLLLPTRLRASRRFHAIGVAFTTLLAIASGFLILYLKAWLKQTDLKDWAKWWHIAWSWFSLAFFATHTWVNRVGLLHYWRALHARARNAALHAALYALLVAAFLWTWSPPGPDRFTDPRYLPLTLYTWLATVGPAYAVWGFLHLRHRWRGLAFPAWARRLPVRGAVDVALVPVTLLANLSGVPLTYFKDELHANGYKYVSKYWHTWPSIVMAILVFVHTVQLWRPLRAHWRGVGRR